MDTSSKAASKQLTRLVMFMCGYELAALATKGKIPTISELDARTRHTLAPLILGGLAAHLFLGWPDNDKLKSLAQRRAS